MSETSAFTLKSPAFESQQSIPTRFTCDGENISPPLNWSGAPTGVKSFVLLLEDPDAPSGLFTHWVLFNIPAIAQSLPEAVPAKDELSDGSRHGRTSWRRNEYGGPCPPSGVHRYFFTLYAMDTVLNLPAGASKNQVLDALEGHTLAKAELVGKYSRK